MCGAVCMCTCWRLGNSLLFISLPPQQLLSLDILTHCYIPQTSLFTIFCYKNSPKEIPYLSPFQDVTPLDQRRENNLFKMTDRSRVQLALSRLTSVYQLVLQEIDQSLLRIQTYVTNTLTKASATHSSTNKTNPNINKQPQKWVLLNHFCDS